MTTPIAPTPPTIKTVVQYVHDTLIVHDTIPKIVKETVYVLKESAFAWDKWASAAVGIVAVAIAVKGWKKNQILARENQVKSFEEGILDKIRFELIPLFSEHREWVYEYMRLVNLLTIDNANYEYRSVHGNPQVQGDSPAEKFYKQPLDFTKLNEFMAEKNNRKWMLRLFDYQEIFKPMVPVLEVINNLHLEICFDMGFFVRNYNPLIPDYLKATNHLHRMTTKLDQLANLRDQFFRFFQYECLKSIDRLKAVPIIKVMSYHDSIIRESDEVYKIVDSPEKISRAKMEPVE